MSMSGRKPQPSAEESAQVELLADELFAKIQASQGYFFVSDGEGCGMTRPRFFDRMRGRLEHGREAVRIMRVFLVKYGELRPPPGRLSGQHDPKNG